MSEFKFKIEEAVRASVPVTMGIVGATGAGKTGSALEVATGFQDIYGGDIGLLETDGKRSLAYAGAPMFSEPKRNFKFKRVGMEEPFSPLHYKAGLDYLISQGVKHAIVDSTSHMHEGPGGTLDAHAKEVERIKDAWKIDAGKANFPAWVKPKAELTAFVQHFKRLEINLIFCFRAKEKMKMVNNKPYDAGWQPIANEELFYEMDLACMLLPNSDGQPIWNHDEHKPVKALPAHFRSIFNGNPRLSAALGRQLATWSKGGAAVAAPLSPMLNKPLPPADPQPIRMSALALGMKSKFLSCTNDAQLIKAWEEFNEGKGALTPAERVALSETKDTVKASFQVAA